MPIATETTKARMIGLRVMTKEDELILAYKYEIIIPSIIPIIPPTKVKITDSVKN